jgi:hypothetical protein
LGTSHKNNIDDLKGGQEVLSKFAVALGVVGERSRREVADESEEFYVSF